jgi:hypothetical protein
MYRSLAPQRTLVRAVRYADRKPSWTQVTGSFSDALNMVMLKSVLLLHRPDRSVMSVSVRPSVPLKMRKMSRPVPATMN